MSTNITWHNQTVSRTDRWKTHKGAVIWLTGLSGSGKSSVANSIEQKLGADGHGNGGVRSYLLDGDNLRHGLCADLGFSVEDRTENVRRCGEVAKVMADAGIVTLTALISPYKRDRNQVRKSVQQIDGVPFIEVYVKASLQTCEQRDPKGLYKMAREGKIKQFTGIDDPYEEPDAPELVLDADHKTVDELAEQAVTFILEHIKL
jgi:adenylylsulfate kinase